MKKLIVDGGHRLTGTVRVSGAKNAAVAIIPATILARGVCVLENIPNISDVKLMLQILQSMGADVKMLAKDIVRIDTTHVRSVMAPYELVRKMRASSYLLGVLLGRFSQACVPVPGGCDFGVRPIDQHLKGFKILGAEHSLEGGDIKVFADKLMGGYVYLDVVSVGATINIMLAATLAEGKTVIENVAKEPHIVDLANFLNSMGADIRGAGTDVIKIQGAKSLHGARYTIIPDQIEAGTYMISVAATNGDVTICDVIPKHLEVISAKLREMGVDVYEYDDSVRVVGNGFLSRCNVKTMPYPGFPTDMQPQIVTLMSIANGTSIVNENVWDNRFRYIEELKRFGAKVSVDGKIAVVEGPSLLTAAPVKATDLRAGAALMIAALAAKGESSIENVEYIERGYENIVFKLRSLGAKIKEVYTPNTTIADVI